MLEMLVACLIATILLSVVVPSQKIFLAKSTADIAKLQLLRAINLARREAMIRKEIVTLCHSSNQKTCAGNWRDGYIILANTEVIYAFLNTAKQGQLYWRAFPKNQTQLDYLPSGALQAENGTFWYCLPAEKNPSWAITLSRSGRARVVRSNQQGEMVVNGDKKVHCD